MGYPLGKAPTKVGTAPAPETVDVLQGTQPVDMQRIIGAQYVTSGLLPSGGGVVSGTSSMAYAVSAGAAFMWVSASARLGMLVPFEATTVQTNPAPATGSRTDTLYVDGAGAVRVAIGSSSAPTGVAIGRFNVPAGITATTAASQSIDRDYAIPAGATMGLLHRFHDPANGNYGNVDPITLGTGRFVLPSDRLVRFDLTWTSSGENNADGVARWFVYVDDQPAFARNWHYSGAHPTTHYQQVTLELPAGTHKVHYVQQRQTGARFRHHKGGPDGWLGNRFEVWDGGVSR